MCVWVVQHEEEEVCARVQQREEEEDGWGLHSERISRL